MMSSVLCKLKTRRTETAQIKNSYWSFAPHIFLRNNSDLLSTNSLHSSLSSWVCWLISGSNTRTLFSSSKWNPAGPSAIFDRDLNVSQKALRLTNIFRLVGKALIGNLRTTTTTLSTTTGSEIPCTAQARLTNFVVVVSSTTPNTVESRRPAVHKLRQV